MAKTEKGLLVTTAHRGVFFGYGEITNDKIVRLTKARMCVYWTSSVKGVLGLAVTGPDSGARITPAVDVITLQDVTSITECTPTAIKNWEHGFWGS